MAGGEREAAPLDSHEPGIGDRRRLDHDVEVTLGDHRLERGARRFGDRPGEPADRQHLPAAVVDERRGHGRGLRGHQIRLVPGGGLERREQRLGLPGDASEVPGDRRGAGVFERGVERSEPLGDDRDRCRRGNREHRDRRERERARAGQHPRRYEQDRDGGDAEHADDLRQCRTRRRPPATEAARSRIAQVTATVAATTRLADRLRALLPGERHAHPEQRRDRG